MLPNKIEGAGVKVFLLDSTSAAMLASVLELRLHTLIIILDGSMSVNCAESVEVVNTDEAIMMKKDGKATITVTPGEENIFRCLMIFFDEPSLKYALMPFELTATTSQVSVLKIPLNEKIKVFTESILLYYQSFKAKNNWTLLLQSKLRELIWIFFHTEIKKQAKEFFSVV